MIRTNICLTRNIYDAIKQLAKEEQISLGELVRRILADHMRRVGI